MDDIEVRDAASSLSLTPSTRVAFIEVGVVFFEFEPFRGASRERVASMALR